jgi:hypothetical protein
MGAADGRMSLAVTPASAQRIREALTRPGMRLEPAACLRQLVCLGLDQLPMPGSGATLERFRALAAVAEHDLSLAKLYEGHTDALAILSEVDSGRGCTGAMPRPPGKDAIWGVWASEAPGGRVAIQSGAPGSEGAVRLQGVKQWCSGAKTGSHALLTVWHADVKEPLLAWLALAQPGVQVSDGAWQAVGMNGSASLKVRLDGASACLVGQPGQYLSRPGFWHGGAGVAACWYGGSRLLAKTLYRAVDQSAEGARSPFRLAAAGKVAVLMRGAALLLQDAARWIDEHPQADASEMALRVRLATAQVATDVLEEVGRALGATPFCLDAAFARMAADLPVFIRQSHAERDYAALGHKLCSQGEGLWAL